MVSVVYPGLSQKQLNSPKFNSVLIEKFNNEMKEAADNTYGSTASFVTRLCHVSSLISLQRPL